MLEAAREEVELEVAPLELLQVWKGGQERGWRLVLGWLSVAGGAVGNARKRNKTAGGRGGGSGTLEAWEPARGEGREERHAGRVGGPRE